MQLQRHEKLVSSPRHHIHPHDHRGGGWRLVQNSQRCLVRACQIFGFGYRRARDCKHLRRHAPATSFYDAAPGERARLPQALRLLSRVASAPSSLPILFLPTLRCHRLMASHLAPSPLRCLPPFPRLPGGGAHTSACVCCACALFAGRPCRDTAGSPGRMTE